MRRYGLTTDSLKERNAGPIWQREGSTREDAIHHAKKAATHMKRDVFVVEDIDGLTNQTRISPDSKCPCVLCR